MLEQLNHFDAYMEEVVADWNAPGIAVGIIRDTELIWTRGYGYRNYAKKLPITPSTMFPIFSNTKLFTAILCGMLVEEGLLTYDEPIRRAVPSIRFFNDELNATVTLRDMLAHRTGISRHNHMWWNSPLSRPELFERLQFLEPAAPPRQMALYNNLMYEAAGYIIELKTGKSWETFVRERLFAPLEMRSTGVSHAEMLAQPEVAVPFNERRDGAQLYEVAYYDNKKGRPAGSICSNIEDLSHWLAALMNGGRYDGRQIVSPTILTATLEPAIFVPDIVGDVHGVWNGMGRFVTQYKGRQLTFHGGGGRGFTSQISFLPQEKIGVIVFVIGDHCSALPNPITFSLYDRILGLEPTPWIKRAREVVEKGRTQDREASARAGLQIPNIRASHSLADYVGEYVHEAYGQITIVLTEDHLDFRFHGLTLPLQHVYFDRFDTPDDELEGTWSVRFLTNPQGEIDKFEVLIDEADVTFRRQAWFPDARELQRFTGIYEDATGARCEVVLREKKRMFLRIPFNPETRLFPYLERRFSREKFASHRIEFEDDNGVIVSMIWSNPKGKYAFHRIIKHGLLG